MENENKRFKLYEHKDNDYILDNPNEHLDFIEMLGDALTSEEIVNLLNELHEENEQLKQAYVKLKHYHSNLHDECIELEWDKDRYYKDVLTLEQENEQLKKENKTFEHHLSELQGENEILTKENETLKNNLKEID